MRRRQEDRLHVGIVDRLLKLGGEAEAVLLRERLHLLRLLAHAMNEPQPCALALYRGDERLAPAAEADDRRVDHSVSFPETRDGACHFAAIRVTCPPGES